MRCAVELLAADISNDLLPGVVLPPESIAHEQLGIEQVLLATNSGQAIAGWKLVKGRSDRVWKDPKKAAEALTSAGVGSDKIYTPMELISPAQVEGLLGKEKFAELMSDVVTKGDARPTLAPENDRRRAVNDVLDALNTAGL